MQGQIIKIVSDLHIVSCEGETYPCKCRGIFRKEHITPLVGDYVLFSKEKCLIEEILPRKSEFQRPKVSNIDQAFLITSLVRPDFSTNLLDKLLVTMELHNVEAVICITKEDLVTEEKKIHFRNILSYYESVGYKVVYNYEIDKIKSMIKDKSSVFTGQTGAGKSTLLNKLHPGLSLETGEISEALGRGKHTTRVVELFELFGGKVMDTPGFSAIDFNSFSKTDIKEGFVEFSLYPCPFRDCNHVREEECSVREAVSDGLILESRYLNYLNFIGEDK